MSKRLEKIISIALYSLPAIFFIVCYFLIITSGEDILQGAETTPDVIGDGVAAFNHSSRLADMYAWSVINFFNYSFKFGPDTFFRLIDVFAALSLFYIITYIALKRRPKLTIKDASIFNLSFLFVFLTQHGYTLYSGFSAIHNYLFIAFFTLLFAVFFIRDLWGRHACPFKNKSLQKLFHFFMFILGFIFGFSSNVTSIVFLLTIIVYIIYLVIKKEKLKIKEFIFSWRGASILGILLALALIYLVGNGLSDYEASSDYVVTYDFLPISDIFGNPLNSIKRVIIHNFKNFGRFVIPFIIALVPTLIAYFTLKKKKLLGPTKFNKYDKRFIFLIITFVVLHILIFSQIAYPTRLVLPAYLLAIAVFLFILLRLINPKSFQIHIFITPLLLILSLAILVIRTYFTLDYRAKVLPTLESIRTSSENSLCIPKAIVDSKNLPIIHLGQDGFLAEWAIPQTVYNKTVTICEFQK